MENFLSSSDVTIFLQLIVAMALGMLLGAERSIAGKSAGMRTYALVSMGACLFVAITILVVSLSEGDAVSFDPLRVLAGVITGIGFIGAGAILVRETTLQGLTTAAGLWVTAAIGVAVGFEFYQVAIFATLLTLFVFRLLWFVERKLEEHLGGSAPSHFEQTGGGG
jgi:putative Mg2+ transporter-C (MgtC) family protein